MHIDEINWPIRRARFIAATADLSANGTGNNRALQTIHTSGIWPYLHGINPGGRLRPDP